MTHPEKYEFCHISKPILDKLTPSLKCWTAVMRDVTITHEQIQV